MEHLDSAQRKAQNTYNAAASHFDAAANAYWDRFGRRTVERLALAPGSTVLDVGCGTGASALVAAEVVGPTGRVLGVDLAGALLTLARNKATQKNFHHVEFRVEDMTRLSESLQPDEAAFDAVVSVFGIFFIEDMAAQLARLWHQVRPNGQLAVTTWGPRLLQPMYDVWIEALQSVRPDLVRHFNPWDRITQPTQVSQLFEDAGISGAQVEAEFATQSLSDASDWWSIVMGSGLRGTVDAMTLAEAERVKKYTVNYAQTHGVTALETNVIYAVARKSA